MKTTKEELEHLYCELELSTREVAKILNCSSPTILRYLKKFNIPTRTKSESLKGSKNPMFGKEHSEETKNKMSLATKALMTDERKKIYSEMFSGENNPMFGVNHTKETKNKMSSFQKRRFSKKEEREKTSKATKEAMKCPIIRNKISTYAKTRVGNLNQFYGKSHSEETKNKISKANKGRLVGEKGSNWRGGKTTLTHKIRNCDLYIAWRKEIFERDNYTCQSCGQRGGKLCADHIKPFSLIIIENNIKNFDESISCEELWSIDNGRTLCHPCHKRTPTYGWGSYWIKVYQSNSDRDV